MNDLIVSIFKDFEVDGVAVPVKYLRYSGDSECYVTFMNTDNANVFSADDEIIAYDAYYDFDVYSKRNYSNVIKSIKAKMKENGFMFIPTRCSSDMFEDDTKFYHKTLCFAKEKGEE